MTNPYKVLGVPEDASDEDIKKAYRTLSRKYHPDANINNPNKDKAEEMFKVVQQAYNQIMKERESGYSGGYSAYGNSTGSQNSGRYRYDGDYQNDRNNGNPYGDFGTFWGFGSFGFGGGYKEAFGDDENGRYFQAAVNYIRNGSYHEALNVLENISERDGRWYYYSAQANAGLGNTAAALEHARHAVELSPDNIRYQQLYRQLQSGGQWYSDRGEAYGRTQAANSDICCRLCIANACCNLFCGSGCLYC